MGQNKEPRPLLLLPPLLPSVLRPLRSGFGLRLRSQMELHLDPMVFMVRCPNRWIQKNNSQKGLQKCCKKDAKGHEDFLLALVNSVRYVRTKKQIWVQYTSIQLHFNTKYLEISMEATATPRNKSCNMVSCLGKSRVRSRRDTTPIKCARSNIRTVVEDQFFKLAGTQQWVGHCWPNSTFSARNSLTRCSAKWNTIPWEIGFTT